MARNPQYRTEVHPKECLCHQCCWRCKCCGRLVSPKIATCVCTMKNRLHLLERTNAN